MQAADTGTHAREDFIIEQNWSSYSQEEHNVWQLMFERRMAQLRTVASRAWLNGAEAMGVAPEAVPDLRLINSRLLSRTGWAAVRFGSIRFSRFYSSSIRSISCSKRSNGLESAHDKNSLQ